MRLKENPSQTAGPYVHIGCLPKSAGLDRFGAGGQLGQTIATAGATISLEITIVDGAGELVRDALVEIWQADPDGRYTPTDAFTNWGRAASDFETGVVRFETLKPGPIGGQAPHILVWIAARGINIALMTRIYFPDEENASDPVFIHAGSRFKTLIAEKTDQGYAHTIRLQGANETVFFDV